MEAAWLNLSPKITSDILMMFLSFVDRVNLTLIDCGHFEGPLSDYGSRTVTMSEDHGLTGLKSGHYRHLYLMTKFKFYIKYLKFI